MFDSKLQSVLFTSNMVITEKAKDVSQHVFISTVVGKGTQ